MHVRRALALTVLAPLLLAGCSGGDDPDPTPTPKMPDSSSASPTPTESETPEVESAEDFVRRWVEVDREMQNSGDVDAYLLVSAKCKTCVSVADRIRGIYEAGGTVRTRGLRVLDVKDQSPAGGRRILDVRVQSAPTVIRESAGAQEQELPGGVVTYRMRLNAKAPWQLMQITQLAS